jgi:ABC-type Zn uptake system ZnuABC Zn-binding protein ZnuA
MKRSMVLFAFILLLAGGTAQAKLKVVTTLSDLASITEEVGGDRVEVEYIVDGTQDVHYVEILPSYMLMLKRAKVFVKIGLDLELWSFQVVEGARNRNLHIVDCSPSIQVLQKPTGPVHPGMGDIHVSGNPHYWLDPANGILIAREIVHALMAADGEGAPYYQERLADFEARLNAKIAEWKALMADYAGTEIIYFHNSWPYFNQAFGLVGAEFVEPKPGVNPSPHHTAEVIQLIKAKNIKVIATSPYFDKKVPESIARQTGAQVVTLASSVGGVEGADDYFSLFDENLRRLTEALGPPQQ